VERGEVFAAGRAVCGGRGKLVCGSQRGLSAGSALGGTALRVCSFLTTLLTRACPRISPFGSRSGGIYPERPGAPVFVLIRVVRGPTSRPFFRWDYEEVAVPYCAQISRRRAA
jgi:hypothetical protein